MIYEGLLIMPEDVRYQFQLKSDDGSHFFLNEKSVIYQLHASDVPIKINTDLKKNKTYYIRVHFQQRKSAAYFLLKSAKVVGNEKLQWADIDFVPEGSFFPLSLESACRSRNLSPTGLIWPD